MPDVRRAFPTRPVQAIPESSRELILSICTHEVVAGLLRAHGADASTLRASEEALRDSFRPESADWRLRLAARGGDDGDLALLLAISRSADCQAYQLLEHAGIRCTDLRRDIVDALRATAGNSVPDRRLGSMPTRTIGRVKPATAPGSSPRRASAQKPSETARAPIPRASGQAAPDASSSLSPSTSSPRPRPVPRGPQPLDPDTLPTLCGRTRELARLADAIGRRRVRAPLLVGPPGSGRSLLASHLAKVLPDPVVRLDATAYDSEERFVDDIRAVESLQGIAILDDLDRVPSEAAPSFVAAMSHVWTTGKPRMVVVTSPDGHGRLTTWLPGVMESVDVVSLDPLEGPDLEAAVHEAGPKILAEHGLSLHNDAKLGELTRWAERFLTGLAMPARALDLLDLACARTLRQGGTEVRRATWLEIVSEWSGLPPTRIEACGDRDVLDLERKLADRVVGHGHAIAAVAGLIRRNRAGFGGQRPILTALLLGPSGVGKTELAKALSHALFDREDALLRLDMSEFSEPHAVARIIGAPPGYVGHERGGALSDPMLNRPHCVVLLDEIEKAHRDVHLLLLGIFDEGRLTDGRGRLVDFRHAAIIMTSNLGSDRIVVNGGQDARMDESQVLRAARDAFPIELWNRIEAPLVMQPLLGQELTQICRRLVRQSSDRLLKERGIRFELSTEAYDHMIALAGRDPSLGARPLRHLLKREVESPIADAILRGKVRAGGQLRVDVDSGRFTLR